MSDAKETFIVEEESDEGIAAIPPSLDTELDKYSEGVQKRINEERAKRAHAERELVKAREFGSRAADIAKRAVAEVENLRGRVASTEDASISNLVDSIGAELTVARKDLEEAYEAADPKAIAEATTRLAATAADLRRAQINKAGHVADMEQARLEAEERARQPPVQSAPKPPPRQVVPKAQAWIERNATWFQKDQAKTRIAVLADQYVAGKGVDPNSDDYYKEVDRMIAAELNGATSGDQMRDQRSSAQAVSPAGRSSAPAGTARKVTLTHSEVSVAKKLGITPEDYAKAKLSGGIG